MEDRRNIRLMLKRKKIRNRSEYNFVMDRIMLAEQSGEITPKEAQLLSQLIGEFEQQSENDLDRNGEARTE